MKARREEIRFRASLAGRGNPWPAISLRRLLLLSLLQNGSDIDALAGDRRLGLSGEEIENALTELRRYHLLAETESGPRPTFLVVSREETRRVVAAAAATGRRLAENVAQSWRQLEEAFRTLPIAGEFSLGALSFFLVGGRLLDIELLTRLARDGSLLTPAPHRPSPDSPDAQYFFYAVEGTADDMGAFGLDSRELPWENWEIGTFARNLVQGAANPCREAFDEISRAALDARDCATPQALASKLRIPCLDRETMEAWDELQSASLERLLEIYAEEADAIRSISGIRAEQRDPGVLGEFICWYHHVAYAAAIAALIERDVIAAPEGECAAAIWFRLHPQEGVVLGEPAE